MATMNVNARVQKHRDALRMSGLRLVQIWVPDTRHPSFFEECSRQCAVVAQADSADEGISNFMDESVTEIDGWVA